MSNIKIFSHYTILDFIYFPIDNEVSIDYVIENGFLFLVSKFSRHTTVRTFSSSSRFLSVFLRLQFFTELIRCHLCESKRKMFHIFLFLPSKYCLWWTLVCFVSIVLRLPSLASSHFCCNVCYGVDLVQLCIAHAIVGSEAYYRPLLYCVKRCRVGMEDVTEY